MSFYSLQYFTNHKLGFVNFSCNLVNILFLSIKYLKEADDFFHIIRKPNKKSSQLCSKVKYTVFSLIFIVLF